MAWRLKHTYPKVWRIDGPPTEQRVVADTTMPIGEKAARQQFAFYLQKWVADDPENRHITQKDGLNAWALERPAGCACIVCTTWAAQSLADTGQAREWWWYGGRTEHPGSYVRLKRTEAPVTRATAPTWCVARRKGSHGAEGPIESVLSEHTTKADAMKGLGRAVAAWRDYRALTATKRGDDAYLLKRHAVVQWSVRVERVAAGG